MTDSRAHRKNFKPAGDRACTGGNGHFLPDTPILSEHAYLLLSNGVAPHGLDTTRYTSAYILGLQKSERMRATEFMAGATRIIFFCMSMLASVSQARITEVKRLSDMPLTTWVGQVCQQRTRPAEADLCIPWRECWR